MEDSTTANSMTAIPNSIISFHAEIPDANNLKGDECDECAGRFRCWTSRGVFLTGNIVERLRDISFGHDSLTFRAKIPECFRVSNVIGKSIIFYLYDYGGESRQIKCKIVQHTCVDTFLTVKATQED